MKGIKEQLAVSVAKEFDIISKKSEDMKISSACNKRAICIPGKSIFSSGVEIHKFVNDCSVLEHPVRECDEENEEVLRLQSLMSLRNYKDNCITPVTSLQPCVLNSLPTDNVTKLNDSVVFSSVSAYTSIENEMLMASLNSKIMSMSKKSATVNCTQENQLLAGQTFCSVLTTIIQPEFINTKPTFINSQTTLVNSCYTVPSLQNNILKNNSRGQIKCAVANTQCKSLIIHKKSLCKLSAYRKYHKPVNNATSKLSHLNDKTSTAHTAVSNFLFLYLKC